MQAGWLKSRDADAQSVFDAILDVAPGSGAALLEATHTLVDESSDI